MRRLGQRQRLAAGVGFRPVHRHYVRQQLLQIDGLFGKSDLALRDAGHVEQIVDQVDQMVGLPLDDRRGPTHHGRIVRARSLQRVRGRYDGRQWIPQFVAQDGQELVLAPVGLTQFVGLPGEFVLGPLQGADIGQGGPAGAGGVGDRRNQHDGCTCIPIAQGYLDRLLPALGERVIEEGVEGRDGVVVDEGSEPASLERGRVWPAQQQLACGRVGLLDGAIRLQCQKADRCQSVQLGVALPADLDFSPGFPQRGVLQFQFGLVYQQFVQQPSAVHIDTLRVRSQALVVASVAVGPGCRGMGVAHDRDRFVGREMVSLPHGLRDFTLAKRACASVLQSAGG